MIARDSRSGDLVRKGEVPRWIRESNLDSSRSFFCYTARFVEVQR